MKPLDGGWEHAFRLYSKTLVKLSTLNSFTPLLEALRKQSYPGRHPSELDPVVLPLQEHDSPKLVCLGYVLPLRHLPIIYPCVYSMR